MPAPESDARYRPTPQSVELLCERLRHMGVSLSESAARRLLEAVLAIEGARLEAHARGALEASLEAIRRAADDALNCLHGLPPDTPRRDYQLSFPQPEPPAAVSGPRRKIAAPRPPARPAVEPELPDVEAGDSEDEGPRPVFRRRRGR